jgi:hypothetical protein
VPWTALGFGWPSASPLRASAFFSSSPKILTNLPICGCAVFIVKPVVRRFSAQVHESAEKIKPPTLAGQAGETDIIKLMVEKISARFSNLAHGRDHLV